MGVEYNYTHIMNEAFNLSYSIKFQLEKRNEKELDASGEKITITENLPIQMVIAFSGQRLKMFTGHRIDVDKFEAEAQRANPRISNAKKETGSAINKQLVKLENAINRAFEDFIHLKTVPTLEDIKKAFNQAMGKETIKRGFSFFDVFNQFMSEQGKENSWSVSTNKKMITLRNTIIEFDSKLTFAGFDKEKLMAYIHFLQTIKKNRNSTIAKQVKFTKWFLRWAKENKHNVKDETLSYKPKTKKGKQEDNKKIVFFTIDELKHLQQFDPQKDYLTRVKHVFLFCAFSGIRYSDCYNLKKIDIKNDTIEITTQKTDDFLTIQLNKHSKAILDIYKDIDFEGGKALPVISNQKMNLYLKELCQLAGFNEVIKQTYYIGNQRIEDVKLKYQVIGTHTARRSFISNAVALGIPIETIIKWTGHADFKAMEVYLKINEKTKVEQMDKFNF